MVCIGEFWVDVDVEKNTSAGVKPQLASLPFSAVHNVQCATVIIAGLNVRITSTSVLGHFGLFLKVRTDQEPKWRRTEVH